MPADDAPSGRQLLATLGGGALAGLLSGGIVGGLATALSASSGLGYALPFRLVASVRYGPDALILGDEALLTGWLTHLGISATLGILFAAILGRSASLGVTLLFGVAWGAVLWTLMTWLVLPITAPTLYVWTRMTPVWWFVLHLIFGIGLWATPLIERRIAGGPRSEPVVA